MRDKKILIMMATYNGEKYINKQIDSILNGTYRNIELAIQDDGSTDRTIDIISEYMVKDSRVTLYKNETRVHGANANFYSLINRFLNSDYDYYMFADQDDIWDLDKIERYIGYISESKLTGCFLLYSNLRLIDSNDDIIKKEIGLSLNFKITNKKRLFFENIINGNSMLLSKELFRKSPEINIEDEIIVSMYYDAYFAMIAALYGNIYYIDTVLASYRRHGKNVTSTQRYGDSLASWLNIIKGMFSIVKRQALRMNATLHILEIFKNDKDCNIGLINEIEGVINKGGIYSIRYLSENDIVWLDKKRTISHKMVLLMGLHKKYLKSHIK